MGSEILVRSGIYFDPLNPDINKLRLTDIAHGLSNLCRFTGQPVRFYSVAQHSLLVCSMLRVVDPLAFNTKAGQLAALFHDAAEAYLGDVATPLKQSPAWAAYRQYEANLQDTIERRYVFPEVPEEQDWGYIKDSVKQADDLAFVFEAQHLMGKDYRWMLMPGIEVPPRENFRPWNPPEAKRRWLEHHANILGG